jgi:hypothetical protein
MSFKVKEVKKGVNSRGCSLAEPDLRGWVGFENGVKFEGLVSVYPRISATGVYPLEDT